MIRILRTILKIDSQLGKNASQTAIRTRLIRALHVLHYSPHVPQYSTHVPHYSPSVPHMCLSTPPCTPLLPSCAPVLLHVSPICLSTEYTKEVKNFNFNLCFYFCLLFFSKKCTMTISIMKILTIQYT